MEKILLIIAYQLSRQGNRAICPLCGWMGSGHRPNCELGEMEKWVREELMKLWRKEIEREDATE